ncbi:MAG TPA: helix-turn-helix transcriptional regulator [Thermoanaerobaculia bacterium]|nr:helix-turn-helix transcriptional regulator [Thermoanaerobaculia bacterium]
MRLLREETLGLEQSEFASVVGVAPKTVSDWERGDITLKRARVAEIAAEPGIPPQLVDVAFEMLDVLRNREDPDRPLPVPLTVPAVLVRSAAESWKITLETLDEAVLAAQVKADRRRARATWAKIKPLGFEERQLAIERVPGFATWALAELLGERSLDAAPEKPKRALAFGQLALAAAEIAPGSPKFREHVMAHARARIGNAHRVAGLLHDGELAFLEARRLWPVGEPSPGKILSEARLFDLEASLRRDQRLFPKALALVDEALVLTPEGTARGRLFLKQSSIFEQQGDPEKSLESLDRAMSFLGEGCTPRLRMLAHLLMALNFDHLGRHEEALAVIPVACELAAEAGSRSNLDRLLWLRARAWSAIGHGGDAVGALEQVHEGFRRRGQSHDQALAGLELAALYLDEGRTVQTRELARKLEVVFRSMGIKREQLSAVWLFLESAEREAATAELARQAAASFRAFRHLR